MNQAEFHFPIPPQAPPQHRPEPIEAPVDDEPLGLSSVAATRQSAYIVRFMDYPHPTADIPMATHSGQFTKDSISTLCGRLFLNSHAAV